MELQRITPHFQKSFSQVHATKEHASHEASMTYIKSQVAIPLCSEKNAKSHCRQDLSAYVHSSEVSWPLLVSQNTQALSPLPSSI